MGKVLENGTAPVAFLICAIGLLSACSKPSFSTNFNPGPFRNSPTPITLCFDLRNDTRPTAGLIIKVDQTVPTGPHTVALPFESTDPSLNSSIYAAWGSYDDTTIINYYTSPTNGIYDLSFVPKFGTASPAQWSEDPKELTQSSIFLIKSSSLTRHFIFKYPDGDNERQRWLGNVSSIANSKIDSIGIILPENVEGRAIRRTNRTSVPDPIHEAGGAKFYPATQSLAQGVGAIHIKYELPPTQNQKALIEEITKAVIVFISPSVQLIVRVLRKPGQKKSATRLIWIFGSIQAIVLFVLIYLAITSWQESVGRAITQLVTATLAGIFTAYNIWEEKKGATPPSAAPATPANK